MSFLDKYYKWIKIFIMLCAYSYLAYILINFDNYEAFKTSFSSISLHRFIFLFVVLLSLPINLLFEAIKWKTLVAVIQPISLKEAYKSVLAGITTGFFTPNRIGEPLGKVMFLQTANRSRAVALSYLGGFGQSFATFLCGIIAGFLLMFIPKFNEYQNSIGMQTAAILFLIMFVSLYFSLPYLCRKVASFGKFTKINYLLEAITHISVAKLFTISLLSVSRYAVYVCQYFFLLLFFGVDITFYEAIIAIPINYLLVSITPSIAFAELGIRGSYAIIILGAFTENIPAVALAGVTVWLVNYVVPMMLGSLLLTAKKKL